MGELMAERVKRHRARPNRLFRERADQGARNSVWMERLRTALEDEVVPAVELTGDQINPYDFDRELIKKALVGLKTDALKKNNAEWSVRVATARAEARVTKLDDRRPKQTGTAGKGSAGKAFLTDEAAVQMMLTAHQDPTYEWSKNGVRTLTGVGLDRAEKLIPLWLTAATEQAGGKSQAVNQ
jgi:hypothetical protein